MTSNSLSASLCRLLKEVIPDSEMNLVLSFEMLDPWHTQTEHGICLNVWNIICNARPIGKATLGGFTVRLPKDVAEALPQTPDHRHRPTRGTCCRFDDSRHKGLSCRF